MVSEQCYVIFTSTCNQSSWYVFSSSTFWLLPHTSCNASLANTNRCQNNKTKTQVHCDWLRILVPNCSPFSRQVHHPQLQNRCVKMIHRCNVPFCLIFSSCFLTPSLLPPVARQQKNEKKHLRKKHPGFHHLIVHMATGSDHMQYHEM